MGTWITDRIYELNYCKYDKTVSDNMGVWVGMIEAVSRRVVSDGSRSKLSTVFFGVN
jgi:hypothetical protein